MAFFPAEIIVDKAGQTCNRFWSYLDSAAKAVVSGKKLWILFWDKDIRYYDALRKSGIVSFPLYNPKLASLFPNTYLRLITYIFGNRPLVHLYSRLGEKHGFVSGWKRRNDTKFYPSVIQEMRRLFKPNENIVQEVDNVLGRYRDDGFFIIGVHIRAGDYRSWEGGKYYFNTEEYTGFMIQLASLYRDRKVCFFISSNEEYDRRLFDGMNLVDAKFPTSAHDLYALSLCDRIIGPLSTFSRWASLYGSVPLCFIEKGKVISECDFSVIESFYRFRNGKEIINLSDK